MKAGGGKKAGSSWEREIAKTLTLWATGQEKPYIYWRTPGSGMMASTGTSTQISGDIIAIRPEGEFLTSVVSIETKVGYEDVDVLKMFKPNKNNTLEAFWQQCIRDAKIANKYGMLIYKKKGYPAVVGIEMGLLYELDEIEDWPKSLTINFNNELPVMMMYTMEEFFKLATPKMFKEVKYYDRK